MNHCERCRVEIPVGIWINGIGPLCDTCAADCQRHLAKCDQWWERQKEEKAIVIRVGAEYTYLGQWVRVVKILATVPIEKSVAVVETRAGTRAEVAVRELESKK